jgi:hypothetical protein
MLAQGHQAYSVLYLVYTVLDLKFEIYSPIAQFTKRKKNREGTGVGVMNRTANGNYLHGVLDFQNSFSETLSDQLSEFQASRRSRLKRKQTRKWGGGTGRYLCPSWLRLGVQF